MGTRLFLRSGEPATVPNPPAGFLSAWDQGSGVLNAGQAALLDTAEGHGQLAISKPADWNPIPPLSVETLGFGQWLSPLLQAQTIAAGAWILGFAASLKLKAGTLRAWEGKWSAFLVDGSTGLVRSTLVALGTVGFVKLGLSETTCYTGVVSLPEVQPQDGDYFALECGLLVSSGSTGCTLAAASALYDSGTLQILSDGRLIDNAASYLLAPQTLLFK